MLSDLAFLADLPVYEKEKPYRLFIPHPETEDSNVRTEQHSQIEITDAREYESTLRMDEQGFRILQSPSTAVQLLLQSTSNSDQLIDEYLQDMMATLRRKLKTKHILYFDWRV